MADNTSARRLTNKHNALLLAGAGVAVFPSSGKVPLILKYNKLDTTLTKAERDAAVEEYQESHDGKRPIHIGATRDAKTITRLWREYPDAVPSIACGPSGLVVLDHDIKDNGPELIDALWAEHGEPEGAPVIPSKSGGKHTVFADPENKFTNKAGLLKKNYGTDVRGSGGQFVAPGSIREDGKTYGTKTDLKNFIVAYAKKSIPTLPPFIVELIGAAADHSDDNLTPTQEREVVKQLQDTDDWEQFEHAFDPTLGYDLDALRESNAEFKELYDDPSDDCSTNRFLAARHIMREWPDMPVQALSMFFEQWEGSGEYTDDKPRSGEYDDRQIAREWIKNQGLSKASNGDAFEPVELDPDDADYVNERVEDMKREKIAEQKAGELRFMSEVAVYAEPDYVVENLFTPQMLGMMHGASNVGKTFSVIHMGESITEGWQWFGRNVTTCGVLYCYGEGHAGLQNRAVAYRERYEPKGDGMIVRSGIPNLGLNLAKAIKALRKSINEATAMRAARGQNAIGVVFLDTWAKAIAGAQENDGTAMQPILNALRTLCVELNVCIIFIHHSGKDTMLGARGSSAIIADVDFNLEIIDSNEAKKRKISLKPGNLCIVAPKMRESGKGGTIEFKLEEVTLGTNRWGNPVTSMVVAPIAPSKGDALDAVTDEDEEVAITKDELTAEQNRQATEARLSLGQKVLDAMRPISKLVGQEMHASVIEVCKAVPALAKLKAETPVDNFARELKKTLFGGEYKDLVGDGWLAYVAGSGRRLSTFVFTPQR